jgi:hypothetical protein
MQQCNLLVAAMFKKIKWPQFCDHSIFLCGRNLVQKEKASSVVHIPACAFLLSNPMLSGVTLTFLTDPCSSRRHFHLVTGFRFSADLFPPFEGLPAIQLHSFCFQILCNDCKSKIHSPTYLFQIFCFIVLHALFTWLST